MFTTLWASADHRMPECVLIQLSRSKQCHPLGGSGVLQWALAVGSLPALAPGCPTAPLSWPEKLLHGQCMRAVRAIGGRRLASVLGI